MEKIPDVSLTIQVNGRTIFGPVTGEDMYMLAKYAGYANDQKGARVDIVPPIDFLGITLGRMDKVSMFLEPVLRSDSRTYRFAALVRAFLKIHERR